MEPYSTSYKGRQVQQSSPFLITSVSRMDHGTICNHQIVWWGSLRLTPTRSANRWPIMQVHSCYSTMHSLVSKLSYVLSMPYMSYLATYPVSYAYLVSYVHMQTGAMDSCTCFMLLIYNLTSDYISLPSQYS